MTIRTPLQAAEVARTTTTNVPGRCQEVTRGYYNAPSAGDVDHDGDADAWDGWLSEPLWARRPGDRKPPRGYPVSFSKNGALGHGHRAESFGDVNGDGEYLIRSTDFDTATKKYKAGVVGTGTIAEIERAMGVTYLGWSKTIDGHVIPDDAPAKPSAPTTPAKPAVKPVKPGVNPVLVALDNDWTADRVIDWHRFDVLIKHGGSEADEAKAARDAIATVMGAFLKGTGRA